MLIQRREVQEWKYESTTYQIGDKHYTPDFSITWSDGRQEYHEIKGWMDPKSAWKLEQMKSCYPNVRIIVIGEDEYIAIEQQYKDAIPDWE